MRAVLVVAFLMISAIGFTQSHSKGTLSFNAGFDGGGHASFSEAYYQGTLVDRDTSGAVTTLFRFDSQCNFLNWLSAGFFFRTGKYIEDPDDPEAAGNKVTDFSFGTRVYAVNKDKFVLYFGVYYGASNLSISRSYANNLVADYKWKGTNLSADVGFNWYFAKYFGLNFSLGYSGHQFDLKEYYINGSSQNLTDWKHTFDTKGAHLAIGLSFHIFGE